MQNSYGGWIVLAAGSPNPDSCALAHVLLPPTHSQYKELTAFLFAAYTTGKPVNIYVEGCHSAGYKQLSFVISNWN